MNVSSFDAVVVGGGHAGLEAARAISARGFSVCLLTLDPTKLGAMSCNPAIGGVGKSHLVFEVDAMGGWMGHAADESGIQFRRLNLNKGPAVRSTRAQCDKWTYQSFQRSQVKTIPNITVLCGEAKEVLSQQGQATGVLLRDGSAVRARAVVITSGTFMGGLMFCGDARTEGGRFGDSASVGLSLSLAALGHRIKRLKTGTPARLDARSIDFSKTEPQIGDPERRRFSWRSGSSRLPQLACYLTHTSEQTHDVIRSNFSKSPLFSGGIAGVGPRYCPSVEDKVKRFSDKLRHQVYLEPEGLNTNSIYPNGLSTSLPADVQLQFMRTMPGLENVRMIRPGYAVEYDALDPTELGYDLQSSKVRGLFCAGQVNRTSGYEEAAAQGLWAGLNVGQYLLGESPVFPDRKRSYMETLVDDLVSRGTEEPYRMFTSRSEYRLYLREDNSHERLHELGKSLSLLSENQIRWFEDRSARLRIAKESIQKARVRLTQDKVISAEEYLRRPEVTWESLENDELGVFEDEVVERLEIDAKYGGYLKKVETELKVLASLAKVRIPANVLDIRLDGVSMELKDILRRHRPDNLEALSRVPGVTPGGLLALRASIERDVSRGTVEVSLS